MWMCDGRAAAEHGVGDLAHGAVAADGTGRRHGEMSDAGVRVGDDDGHADELEAPGIVHVVADEERVGRVDLPGAQPREHRRHLVVAGVDAVDAELARPGSDHRVALRRQDQDRDARSDQVRDAHAVGAIHDDRFDPALVEVRPIVRVHAVEVGHDGSHVDRVRHTVLRRDEPRGLEVDRVVDLDGRRTHDDRTRSAEEAVAGAQETGGVDDVEGAGLDELLRPVLAALPDGGIVVHPVVPVRGDAPDEAVELRRGERDVAVPGLHGGNGTVEVRRIDERARALHEDHHRRVDVQLAQCVQQRGLRRRLVARQFVGPLDGERARIGGFERDQSIVGRHDDALDRPCPMAAVDRPPNERTPTDQREVLPGHALRSTPGGDDGHDGHRSAHLTSER